MSIKITIEKTSTRTWQANENVVTKKTPTDKKDRYDGALFDEEFAVREVTKSDTSKVTLLEQVIENDADLDLAAVIVSINKIGAGKWQGGTK